MWEEGSRRIAQIICVTTDESRFGIGVFACGHPGDVTLGSDQKLGLLLSASTGPSLLQLSGKTAAKYPFSKLGVWDDGRLRLEWRTIGGRYGRKNAHQRINNHESILYCRLKGVDRACEQDEGTFGAEVTAKDFKIRSFWNVVVWGPSVEREHQKVQSPGPA